MKHSKTIASAMVIFSLQACASYDRPGEIFSERLETFAGDAEFEQYFKTLNGDFDEDKDGDGSYDGAYPPPPPPRAAPASLAALQGPSKARSGRRVPFCRSAIPYLFPLPVIYAYSATY